MKSPPHARLICIIDSLKPKSRVKQSPYLCNAWIKVCNILTVGAWDVTRFYAMLTFCINLISKELLQIIFLVETIFIFPKHLLSCEDCMDYPDFYWLSVISHPFMGVSTLLVVSAWEFLSMVIKIANLKCYLCCVNMENLFKIHIFEISAKNCTCPCNFKFQLPLIEIRYINAKSQIQPRWLPFFLKFLSNWKLSAINLRRFLMISENYLCSNIPRYLVHLPAYSVFSFLQLCFWHLKWVISMKIKDFQI